MNRADLRGYPAFRYPPKEQAVKNPPWIAGTIIKGLAFLGACTAFLSVLVIVARYLESS